MGGRAIPTYCEHGVMVDGGGHFDDADECGACESGEVAQLALEIDPTPAMDAGTQTIWQCSLCGTVVVVGEAT